MAKESNVQPNEQIDTETTETEVATPEETPTVDSDEVVEKLKKRIGREQSEKHGLQEQLDTALGELEKLKSGKSVKDLSEEDKSATEESEKDKTIADLQNQLKLSQTRQQADGVFKDSGINVGPDVLDMVIDIDDEKTYSNTKALIDFANVIQEQTRQEFLKGKTPTNTGNQIKSVTPEQFKTMNYSQRAQLAKDNPNNFRQLTGGI